MKGFTPLAVWPACVACFALGTWAAMQPPSLLAAAWCAAVVIVALLGWGVCMWLIAHRPLQAGVVWWLLAAACSAAAITAFAWTQLFGHFSLAGSLASEEEGRDLVMTGMVVTLPQRIERGVRFGFEVQHCACSVQGQRISLAWYSDARAGLQQAVPHVVPGERWQLTARLKRRHGVVNPQGFDTELWLLEQGFAATGYVRPAHLSLQPHQLLAQAQGGLMVQIERWRAQTRSAMLAQAGDVPQLNVLLALTIGDQRALSQSDWTVYNTAGVGHLLSISGLHVTMFAALMGALALQLARLVPALVYRVPAPVIGWITGWLAALSYALMAGFAVPAQRTVLMLTVVVACRLFARQAHPAHVLANAALMVLIADPFAVLSAGAWFSFMAVAMLMLSNTWAEDVTAIDWRYKLKRAAWAQGAVTVGLVPWSILFFSQVSLISPLANALAIPWISLAVTPVALLGAVLVWPLPAVGGWVLQLAALLMQAIDGVLRSLAHWPWASVFFPAPSVPVFLLASAGAIAVLALRTRYRWLGLLAMLLLFTMPAPRPAPDTWRATFLDVGQGMAVLIETPKHSLLFDTGLQYSNDNDSGQRVIMPYLRAQGVKRLDALVISHADNDHSGGAASVQKALPVGSVISSLPVDHAARLEIAPHRDCSAGQSWQWEQLRFTVLHPPAAWLQQEKHKSNALSCVLQITDGQHTVLLAGDIEAAQEELLVQTYGSALRAQVLLVPHHGSKTSSTAAFLQAVAPQYAVFQNGYRNRFGHPAEQVWQRYGALPVQRLRSDAHGAVTLTFADNNLQVVTARQAQSTWWRTEVALD
jgi:competence protein ComEC